MHFIPDWLTQGLVLVALVPFLGGILSGYSEMFIGKKRSKAKLKRNLIIVGSLLSIVGALSGAVLQGRDSFTLWAYSTGADGYCYLRYLFRASDALHFSVMNDGPYPVFDVSVQLIDHTRWSQLGGTTYGFAGKSLLPEIDKVLQLQKDVTVVLQLGNVRPKEVRLAWDGPVPGNVLQIYYATISARNGYVEEEILLRRNDDSSFVSALRVWKPTGATANGWPREEIVKEEVPDDFRHSYPSGIPWTLDPNNR